MSWRLRKTIAIVVDDNEDHLQLLAMSLSSDQAGETLEIDPSVQTYTDAAEALANLPAEGPAVIICDYSMPGSNGLDWLPDFLKPNIGPVIILTSSGNESIAAKAFRAGAADYLVKSDVMQTPDILFQSIQKSLRRYKLEQCNEELTRKLKTANTELEKKNVRLSELTDTAHRFVDNVAHEFRTPLTVIREFASIISDGLGGPVSSEQAEYLQYIISGTHDLSQMVDDFLDSSKLKTRSLRVDRKPHTVGELFDSIRPAIGARAKSKSITIAEDITPGLEEVFCDLEKAGRVIVNLTVNAIKFSADGGEVRLWAKPLAGGGAQIGVSDHGPGLSQEEIEIVCERFRQVGDPQRTSAKGFGLGLNIAKELIWLNLGQFDIQSEVGVGSTFAFTLPAYDTRQILDNYIAQIVEHDKSANLTVLRVSSPDQSVYSEQLRRFLTSNSQSMDMALSESDGESVLLIGSTAESKRWTDRLESAWINAIRSSQDASPQPIDILWLGTWSGPGLKDHVVSCVLDQTLGVRACA